MSVNKTMKWSFYPLLALWAMSGAFADVSEFRNTDPRLEKKVTLAVNHVKLEEVAKSLSEQSGVDIKAGTGKRDWKVRERKVTIHAKDIQVGQMLEEIPRLVGYHLSRLGKDGDWNYLIWQDQKGRLLEEEMFIAAREAQAKRARDIRQNTLDTAVDALKMSPEEALKKRDKEPLTAYLGGTKPGRGFAQILSSLKSSFPIEYELMMRGQKVKIPVSSFPPSLEGALADIMAGRYATGIEQEEKADLVPHQLEIRGRGFMMRLYALDQQTGDGYHVGFLPMSNLRGKYELLVEDGVDPDEADRQINDEVADLTARRSPTEEKPPTDPELLREIEILEVKRASGQGDPTSGKPEEQGKMIEEIARATQDSVLLESYASMIPISRFIKKGKQPFYHILVAAEKAGCTWELGEGTLRIRPEDWAIQRSGDVPESFLNHYKALLEKNGEFTLDDLAGLVVALTDAQIEGALAADQDLSPAVTTVIEARWMRPMLRAYALMDANQKSQLASEAGLSFGQLTDAQWDHIHQIITDSDNLGGIQIMDGSVRIVPDPEDKPQPNLRVFEITILSPNEEKPRTDEVWVTVPTKAFLKEQQEQRKKAQEAMEKAAAEKAAKEGK